MQLTSLWTVQILIQATGYSSKWHGGLNNFTLTAHPKHIFANPSSPSSPVCFLDQHYVAQIRIYTVAWCWAASNGEDPPVAQAGGLPCMLWGPEWRGGRVEQRMVGLLHVGGATTAGFMSRHSGLIPNITEKTKNGYPYSAPLSMEEY